MGESQLGLKDARCVQLHDPSRFHSYRAKQSELHAHKLSGNYHFSVMHCSAAFCGQMYLYLSQGHGWINEGYL